MRKSDDLLHLIFDYIGKVSQERSIDTVLVMLADMARALIGVERCTLWLRDPLHGELWSKVAHGTSAIRIPQHSGLVGYVVATGEGVIINDPYNDPRFNSEVDKKTGFITKNILTEPIFGSIGVIGAFQALNKLKDENGFNEDDRSLLRLAAVYASGSLQNAEMDEEIEATQREIIEMLGEVGETRSKETGNHVLRVTEYCKLIATRLQLPAKQIGLLAAASPLHDIGKVAIPDSVLLKAGKLTDEEYDIIKTHAKIGYDLLSSSKRELLTTAAIIAYEHHEKYNGKGYPQGLAGEDISILGRITAVADVFDALSSDRCYKKAWPREQIIQLFRDERGQQFDPDCTDALLDDFDEFWAIRDKHVDTFPQ